MTAPLEAPAQALCGTCGEQPAMAAPESWVQWARRHSANAPDHRVQVTYLRVVHYREGVLL